MRGSADGLELPVPLRFEARLGFEGGKCVPDDVRGASVRVPDGMPIAGWDEQNVAGAERLDSPAQAGFQRAGHHFDLMLLGVVGVLVGPRFARFEVDVALEHAARGLRRGATKDESLASGRIEQNIPGQCHSPRLGGARWPAIRCPTQF